MLWLLTTFVDVNTNQPVLRLHEQAPAEMTLEQCQQQVVEFLSEGEELKFTTTDGRTVKVVFGCKKED
jgi:hypothetical protein